MKNATCYTRAKENAPTTYPLLPRIVPAISRVKYAQIKLHLY